MKKTITIRIEEKFLECLDNSIKEANEFYDQARDEFDVDALRRFVRIRKYTDRSDFFESALYEWYALLKIELAREREARGSVASILLD